jgi:hypothetical protein
MDQTTVAARQTSDTFPNEVRIDIDINGIAHSLTLGEASSLYVTLGQAIEHVRTIAVRLASREIVGGVSVIPASRSYIGSMANGAETDMERDRRVGSRGPSIEEIAVSDHDCPGIHEVPVVHVKDEIVINR